VVLLDDVMTTGATMFEAARTLHLVGVKHITGLVFARAELTDAGELTEPSKLNDA